MDFAIALAVFGIIFIGELPDKTMFASVVMSTKGKPLAVWIGASAAFIVHVIIAVTLGSLFVTFLPHRLVQAIVAVLFLVGAFFAFRGEDEEEEAEAEAVIERESSHRRTVVTAFLVIFVAEWGDLTQILTANLAAHYHDALSVAVGSATALVAVAGVAVLAGRALTRLPMTLVRRVTGVILVLLAIFSAYEAISGTNVFL
jgi:putative Ca2+/H+ antiporter (TMEM165/GDT1 family)